MTNKEFENYLVLVSRLLRLKRGQTEQIAGELRDHLELRVAELTESGANVDEATRLALEEFGDAASLAGQFQFISETYKRRWMMRFATISVAGLFLVAVLVMAMWPDGARFGSPDRSVASESGNLFGLAGSGMEFDDVQMSDSTRRTNQARQALTRERAFDYNETEFESILRNMTDEFELTFILDHSARDDSLAEDEPITFRTGNLPANKAFRLMLKEHNATYVIQDGVVRVISLDSANDPEYFARRIFDVSDLLAKISVLESNRILMGRLGLGSSGGGASSGGGIFCVAQQEGGDTAKEPKQSSSTPEETQENDLLAGGGGAGTGGGGGGTGGHVQYINAEKLLVEAITKTIVADSWDNTNGDGTIAVLGGLMIVNQTEETNEKIEELLQDLSYRFAQRKDEDE